MLVACGGGGSDGGVIAPTVQSFQTADISQLATVDQANVAKTMALLSVGSEAADLTNPSDFAAFGQRGDDVNNTLPSLVRKAVQLVTEQAKEQSAAIAGAALSTTVPCDAGFMVVAVEWNGAQIVNESTICDELVDLHGTMNLAACVEDGTYMNGAVNLSYSGSICNPSALTNVFTNFTYRDDGSTDQVETIRLQIDGTDLNWRGHPLTTLALTSGRLVMNGQMVASSDGSQIALAYSNYTEDLDGSYLEVSGAIYGPCLGGWANLYTPATDPIYIPYSDGCPEGGTIIVSGADGASMDVVFNLDGTVTIDGTDIGSCENLDPSCPIQ